MAMKQAKNHDAGAETGAGLYMGMGKFAYVLAQNSVWEGFAHAHLSRKIGVGVIWVTCRHHARQSGGN